MRICVIIGSCTLHVAEQRHEFWQHVGHEKDGDTDADHADERRIDQRRGEFGLHLRELFEVIRHAPQHFHQRTGLLARLDHVHVQIGEDQRLLAHRVGQTAPFHDFLPQIGADFFGNALGLQMRHAVERDGERHAGLEQIRQLLGEGGHLLHLGLAFARQHRRARTTATRRTIRFSSPPAYRRDGGRALGGIHRHGEKPESLNLRQRRGAIRHVQDALDDFARTSPGFVGKLCHKLVV